MGHVLAAGLDLIGTGNNPLNRPELRQRVEKLATLARGSMVNEREGLHVKAIQLLADGLALLFAVCFFFLSFPSLS